MVTSEERWTISCENCGEIYDKSDDARHDCTSDSLKDEIKRLQNLSDAQELSNQITYNSLQRANEQSIELMKELRECRERERELHDNFECEDCEHNIHHPEGDRCGINDEGVEFCTFLICGRCSNKHAIRERRLRDGIRDYGHDLVCADAPECLCAMSLLDDDTEVST